MQKQKISIIGTQMDLGASKRGVSMGPMAIRHGGLPEGLERLGFEVRDLGDIIPLPCGATQDNMRYYEQVIDVNKRLYQTVSRVLNDGRFPVVLGGDHSISAGSITAVNEYYKDQGGVGVIWIDAHGDWNNEESTMTGNMHGMSYSAVCGYGPDCMVRYGQEPCYVNVKKCVQIGGRDFDPQERARMQEAGITVFPINIIDKLGIHEVMTRAIEIAGNGTAGIHVSFDVDAITPESAPGTGTVVHSGLTVREAFLAVEMLAETEKVVSMDMVEVNPVLDERNKTGILASELVQSVLGKTVY